MKVLIFANNHNGEFYAEHIIEDLNSEFDRLEYGDVFEGEYQLWEYPSGKVFKIEPDRKVLDKDYYSSPSSNLWLPKLTLLKTDKEKINKAYERFSYPTQKKSLLQYIKDFLRL